MAFPSTQTVRLPEPKPTEPKREPRPVPPPESLPFTIKVQTQIPS